LVDPEELGEGEGLEMAAHEVRMLVEAGFDSGEGAVGIAPGSDIVGLQDLHFVEETEVGLDRPLECPGPVSGEPGLEKAVGLRPVGRFAEGEETEELAVLGGTPAR
jgi:hypothetical protein